MSSTTNYTAITWAMGCILHQRLSPPGCSSTPGIRRLVSRRGNKRHQQNTDCRLSDEARLRHRYNLQKVSFASAVVVHLEYDWYTTSSGCCCYGCCVVVIVQFIWNFLFSIDSQDKKQGFYQEKNVFEVTIVF